MGLLHLNQIHHPISGLGLPGGKLFQVLEALLAGGGGFLGVLGG
jgi:hypothetical protein